MGVTSQMCPGFNAIVAPDGWYHKAPQIVLDHKSKEQLTERLCVPLQPPNAWSVRKALRAALSGDRQLLPGKLA